MLLILAAVLASARAPVRGAFGGPEDGGGGGAAQTMDVFRLPGATRPESYDLLFRPNFGGGGVRSTFSGVTRIIVTAVWTTDVVTLNLKDLVVTDTAVTDLGPPAGVGGGDDGAPRHLPIAGLAYHPRNEQFEIRMAEPVPPGRRLLVTVAYHGDIRTDKTGLYMSSYEDGDVIRWLAVTHLQPVYARRAFPCYDEPSYKAIFNVSVVKRKDQIALSNMPVRNVIEVPNDMEVVFFESTPPMSSYLTAIFVGEFVPSNNGSAITVYTHTDNINQTDYIWTEAPKHLQVLENYTGIKYMLPKLDILALPDGYFKGMENWGMNTYEEKYILMNKYSKHIMISTRLLQHEFTHQWFGNLVTCSWWDFAWLNEGFAKYFEYFATGMVKPSWPMEELFLIEVHLESMARDQYPRHPITKSVNTPGEIENIFDTITYSKAASVLRMLRYLVTEHMFQLSIQEYLKANREKVVAPDQLYESFDKVLIENEFVFGNGLTVKEFMTNWTLQSGYPVLNITKNETSNKFSLVQGRFFMNAYDAKENYNVSLAWYIGLTYTTEEIKNFNDTRPSAWTNLTSNLTVIPAPIDTGWYIFNVKSTGYYRVNYDYDNWMALIGQLKESPGAIHVLNRAQLVDDAFNLARAGLLTYLVPLRMSEYLINEDSVTPWYPAMNGLSHLINHMPRRGQGYKTLKTHVGKLAGAIYKKLDDLQLSDGNGESNVETVWDDFAWAYTLDNKYCAAKALKYFRLWQTGEIIPDVVKKAAFCIGVKNSTDPSTFDRMFKFYTTTRSMSEREYARLALGCSANKTQLTEYINHIMDGPKGPIMTYEYRAVIFALSATPLGLEVLYEFLSNNLNRIFNELPIGKFIVNHIYSVLAYHSTNDGELKKIRDLKNNSTVPASVRLSFEELFYDITHYQMRWLDMYPEGISQWAQEYIENEQKEEPQATTTETFDDINRYQLRLYDIYPEKISRLSLERFEVKESEIREYKMQTIISERVPKSSNNIFIIILLFVIFTLLLYLLFCMLI